MTNLIGKLFRSSNHGHRERRGFRASLLALPFVLLFATGCLEEPSFFSPPGGNYAGTVFVTLNLPTGTSVVYYTLDGTEPGENCLIYDGTPIEISQTSVLTVKYQIGVVEQPIATTTYNIAGGGGGGGGGPYTDEDMIAAWSELELAGNVKIADAHNNGCTLIIEAWDGATCQPTLNLNQINFWYFVCDNGNIPAPIADGSATAPAAPAACGGDGYLAMGAFAEGLGGRTDFLYSDYDHALSGGGTLVATARTVGHFDSGGSGNLGTDEGDTAVLSGAFNGTIDSSVTVQSQNPIGGFYMTNCSDPGCSGATETYFISPGPVYTLYVPADPSCEQPWFVIQNKKYNTCITKATGANPQNLLYASCAGIPDQQWYVKPIDTTPATDDFTIELLDGSACLTSTNDLLFKFAAAEACALASATQVWHLQNMGGTSTVINSPFDIYADGNQYCLLGELLLAPTSVPFQAACNPGAIFNQWSFLPKGAFPPINPLTDL